LRGNISAAAYVPKDDLALDDTLNSLVMRRLVEVLTGGEERYLVQRFPLDLTGNALLRGQVRGFDPIVQERLELRKVRPAEPAHSPSELCSKGMLAHGQRL
jgi:hypothetical protein